MSKKRIEYIREKNPELSEQVINELVNTDPTNEKKYLTWLVRIYNFSQLSPTEGVVDDNLANQAKILLTSFEKNKNKFPKDKRDINKFDTLLNLATFLMQFEAESRLSEEEFLKNGAKKLYEDDNWLVASPKTMESAVKLGKGTKWCTSSIERTANAFHSYAGGGVMYIIINKKLKERDRLQKLQLYLAYDGYSTEFRDALNETVDLIDYFKENSEVFTSISQEEIFAEHYKRNPDLFVLIPNPTDEQKIKALRARADLIEHIDSISDESQEEFLKVFYAKKSDGEIYVPPEYKEHFFKAFDLIENLDTSSQVIGVTLYPERMVDYLQEYVGGKLSLTVQRAAVKQDYEVVKKLIKPARSVLVSVLNDLPEMIQYVDKPTEEEQLKAVEYDPKSIKYIEKPAKATIIEAVANRITLFRTYKNDLEDSDIMSILQQSPEVIKFIKNPSVELQMEAIKADVDALEFIKEPDESVTKFAEEEKERIAEEERRRRERRYNSRRYERDGWKYDKKFEDYWY